MSDDQNLYKQELWDEGYKDFNFFIAGDADPVKQFLLSSLPQAGNECFEVGCFPGRYLAVLGERGWELNGLDQTKHLEDMEKWFSDKKYKTGKFINADFEVFNSGKKYDLVYSFGFIEHFLNFEDIILGHLKLVKPGGTIIITTPNFNGLQGNFHRFFDLNNYEKHNVKSMNIKKWKKILLENNFTVKRAEHFGKIDLWYDWQSRPYYKRFFLYRLMSILPLLKKLIFFNSRTLSPFCGIVGIKAGE